MPCVVPAIGLPYRVAAFLLAEGLHHAISVPSRMEAIHVWGIQANYWKFVVEGRRSQFDVRPSAAIGQCRLQFSELNPTLLELRPFSDSAIPAHAAYSIVDTVVGSAPSEFIATWHHALSFITAIDGSERILDQIWESAPSAIPFDERWSTRSRLPMPPVVWQWLEEMARVARTGHVDSSDWKKQTDDVLQSIQHELSQQPIVLPDEFLAERCDVSLDTPDSPEFSCAVERRELSPHQARPSITIDLPLAETLTVRIGQLTSHTADFWNGFPERFPHLRRYQSQRIYRQVTQAFQSEGNGETWEFAVFPEVCLPFEGRPRFERLAAESRRGGVIGCLWREIASAVQPFCREMIPCRYFVNEAFLAIPLPSTGRMAPVVRSFLIRKPLPANSEIALARRLSEIVGRDDAWNVLPGRRVFRFVHPSWGDFTVAICSDLLDPAPWRSMRGQLLHIFLCSYNKDVSLFDSLTWVRAYENFANLVATNCGTYGGSFAWSPRSGESKELARLRGTELFVLADVKLPVRSLFERQRDGTGSAITTELRKWNGPHDHEERVGFKSPPPGFRSRE
ncbi:MAG: hypothetical protein NT069_01800 [Planctomycetota bacterium]|nr:hypothetical protein [Planctomycetota bacterium]